MAQTFFAILTAVGEAKDANAKALGIPLTFTEMAAGDGNGNVPTPDRMRTALINQVRRAPLNSLTRDPVNTNQIIAEQVIPENVGGWWIRELGLYDQDGDLVAIANCPPTYKPQLVEGSGRTQVVRIVLIMSSAESVQLRVDPAVVLATRKFAEDAITASMTVHLTVADPHPQYNAGRLLNVQVFTSSGTYIPTLGMKTAIVEMVGGGGGGGGSAAVVSGSSSSGAGGASGSYAKGRFTTADIGASVAVTIGGGGSGGTGSGVGAVGGTSSFGALMSAPGGQGGSSVIGAPPYTALGGLPGTAATGGNIASSAGQPGGIAVSTLSNGLGGSGAGSPIAQGVGGGGGTTAGAGKAASAPGAGGGGAQSNAGSGPFTGGAGRPGIVIVWEYA